MTASKSKSSPRVTVKVTQEIIDNAARRDSSHCMIADAVREAVPKAQYVSVDLATVRFTDLAAGKRYIYLTPRPAQEALLDFDQGNKPEPFNIRLQSASVALTGTARRATKTTTLEPANEGDTPPVRVGGDSPPLGPLSGGAPKRRTGANPGAGPGSQRSRTARRRAFGLRAIIR